MKEIADYLLVTINSITATMIVLSWRTSIIIIIVVGSSTHVHVLYLGTLLYLVLLLSY